MINILGIIDVLGTEYTVVLKDDLGEFDGLCETEEKMISIKSDPEFSEMYNKRVLLHEIIHAFLYESGLDSETWAVNEEMVDWMALQFLKINEAYLEGSEILRCLSS